MGKNVTFKAPANKLGIKTYNCDDKKPMTKSQFARVEKILTSVHENALNDIPFHHMV